jgi:hypothetical protein
MTYLDSILDQLFWSKVSKSDDCWEWTSHRTRDGYGYFSFRGRAYLAHRFSWELANGQAIGPGLVMCHRCDHPPCVRPDHLFPGTHADNMHDRHVKHMARLERAAAGVAAERLENHCRRGHEMTPINTYTDPKGIRVCRECTRAQKRAYKDRLRMARVS